MKRILHVMPLIVVMLLVGCSQPRQMRIMSYNIHICKGMDKALDIERTAEVIKRVNPDFVGLQEVDSVAKRSDFVDQAKELGRLTGMHYFFAPAKEHKNGGLYGVAALVKQKPKSFKYLPLPGAEEVRTFLILEYDDYLLCNTHFSLRSPSRKESIEIIKKAMAEYGKPAILTGDFNMLPTSEETQQMLSDWQVLSDTTRFTFPSKGPRRTIDYIWGYGKDNKYEVLNYEVLNEPITSDHQPLYADIKF